MVVGAVLLAAGCSSVSHAATGGSVTSERQLVRSYSAYPVLYAVSQHDDPAPYVRPAVDYLNRLEAQRWPASMAADVTAVENGLREWIAALRAADRCTTVHDLAGSALDFGEAEIQLDKDLGLLPTAPDPIGVGIPSC